jgi:hypothetical protein
MSIHPLVFNGISRLCNPDACCGAERKKERPVLPWLLLLEAGRPDALETEKDKKTVLKPHQRRAEPSGQPPWSIA